MTIIYEPQLIKELVYKLDFWLKKYEEVINNNYMSMLDEYCNAGLQLEHGIGLPEEGWTNAILGKKKARTSRHK